MRVKNSIGSNVFDIFNHLLMILLIVIMLYPMMNVVSISLSDPNAIIAGKVTWYPKGFNIYGYKVMLEKRDFFICYKNTIMYAFAGTFLSLFFTSMAAYAMSVKDFVLRKPLTIYWAITMFLSGGLIPTYLVIRSLGGINTFWVMVIPGCVGAYNIIVFRTFFDQQPGELRESGLIDGANEFIIWAKIILPLSKPLLATFALFGIVGHWNSWFPALIYLKDNDRYPLQIFLRRLIIVEELTTGYSDEEMAVLLRAGALSPRNVQMAAIVIAMFPILCIYPYIQRYFVKGVMVGAIKG